MKKIILAYLVIVTFQVTNAQSWNLTLNTISGNPNFGTTNNHPINFFTNGTQRMVLTTTGDLRINRLVGTGSRFLQADPNGNLIEWVGSELDGTKILFGNNTWQTFPFAVDDNNIGTSSGTKFGIGVTTPTNALDVSGDATVSGTIKASGGFLFSSTDGISYDPSENVFTMGKLGGPALPSYTIGGCASLPSPTLSGWTHQAGGGFASSQANLGGATGVNAYLRMYISPLNGSGYIEVNGKDNLNTNNNSLNLNYLCGRNTNINTGANAGYVYIGSSNAASKVFMGNSVSTGTFVSMAKHLEIGDPTTGITNSPNNIALDIHVQDGKGLRLKTTVDALEAIGIDNIDPNSSLPMKSFMVTGDGRVDITSKNTSDEALVVRSAFDPTYAINFKVLAHGYAEIIPQSTNAFGVIYGGTGGSNSFNVRADGFTEIKTFNTKGLSISNGNNSNTETFFVKADGYTEIKTAATKAFAIKNVTSGSSTNETFSVDKNGYTEIKVYSPGGMPLTSYGNSTSPITHPRVITVRDMSNNGQDIFVVRSDGTVFAREIEINNGQNFPDYVFNEEYKLVSIPELERFIQTNKHLPGFEKGEHYEKNGISVNGLLLKQQEKIEELALYIIQLEKRLQSLESK